ncbi:MAG: hypothetical protein AAFQ98_01090 [Bacteroidota bacterium]
MLSLKPLFSSATYSKPVGLVALVLLLHSFSYSAHSQTLWPQFGLAYKHSIGNLALDNRTNLQGLALWVRPVPRYSFSAQYISDRFPPFVPLAPMASPEVYHQVDVMGGRSWGEYLLRFHAHGGLGAIWGTRYLPGAVPCTPAERAQNPAFCATLTESFLLPSLSAKVGVKFVPAHFFSLGLDVQAIITPTGGTFFPSITAEMGLLRDSVWLRRRYSLTDRKRYNKLF